MGGFCHQTHRKPASATRNCTECGRGGSVVAAHKHHGSVDAPLPREVCHNSNERHSRLLS